MNFGEFVRQRHAAGVLVVQPRMGFADPTVMRAGLLATRGAEGETVGTITVDSFTRLGDLRSVEQALRTGAGLNGYPIVTHPSEITRWVAAGVPELPVQVRHGSAAPQDICRALVAAGLHATEGGPVSYCLPYGRTPLADSVRNWRESCQILLESTVDPHLETFGGCLMGQLCPPSLLVAISVLEAMFFAQQGIRDLSVSYAQQTNPDQDREAVFALRRLCAELLPGVARHVVIYAHMGRYPRTVGGANELLARAAELAAGTGAARLIVKTVAEAHRIPTIAENVAALELAAGVARRVAPGPVTDGQVYREARVLVEAVLDVDSDVGRALVLAFRRGLLDVPYCLHPDNAGRARGCLDSEGRLRWADIGGLPLAGLVEPQPRQAITAADFLASLSYLQDRFDTAALARSAGRRPEVEWR